MVKPLQRSEIQGFSKGLQTDLNPLNSQLDTTSAESNYELHRDGTRSRRLGLNIEVGGTSFPIGSGWTAVSSMSVSTFLWEGAAGEPDNKFVVVHIGGDLQIFQYTDKMIHMQTIAHGYGDTRKLQFGAVEGYLSVVNGTPNIGLIEYSPITELFSYSTFRLKIRDQFGIAETIEPRYETDVRFRGALNWQHYYNLYNQGWAIPRKDWVFGDPPPIDAVLLGSNNSPGTKSPSNSDVVWSGIDRKPIDEQSLENFEAFHYRLFEGITGADAKAGKGFFIIDAFNRGSSRYDAWVEHRNNYPQTGNLVSFLNPPGDATAGGPTSVAAHAGRLFFSGCSGYVSDGDARSPNYTNYVFFTQLIKNKQDFVKCYQEGDPTSRESNDVVDTDGGFIVVSEAINLHSMYSIGDRLILIAENGVWSITGGSNYGFAATNYKVEKLSTFGGIPNKSFVEFGGQGFFWGWDGIYAIAKNQFGDYEVTNLTKDSNDKFFSAIPTQARLNCQGFVDKSRRQVRWVYVEGVPFDTAVTKEIIFDLKFQAMYPFTIMQQPLKDAYVVSGVQMGDFGVRYIEDGVYVENEPVYVNDDPVGTIFSEKTVLDSNVKYLTIYDKLAPKLCFTEYNDVNFEDWLFTGDVADAYAFMETNYFTGGDFAIKKQVPWLVMAFAETERFLNEDDSINRESSCIGRMRWNFSHSFNSNKWSRDMQLYRKSRWGTTVESPDNGFSINVTKTKVRGIGKSFSLLVHTEPRKDCHIFGWNITLTSNSVT